MWGVLRRKEADSENKANIEEVRQDVEKNGWNIIGHIRCSFLHQILSGTNYFVKENTGNDCLHFRHPPSLYRGPKATGRPTKRENCGGWNPLLLNFKYRYCRDTLVVISRTLSIICTLLEFQMKTTWSNVFKNKIIINFNL